MSHMYEKLINKGEMYFFCSLLRFKVFSQSLKCDYKSLSLFLISKCFHKIEFLHADIRPKIAKPNII